MSNILYIRVVETRTLGQDHIQYEVQASDAYHEAILNSFDTLAKLYESYGSKAKLIDAVSSLDAFEGLDYSLDDDGTIILEEHAPYSGITIEGFEPEVSLRCDKGHPLMYLANNRFSASVLFTTDTQREVNALKEERDEQVICNHPGCQASINSSARQRVLEEGRNFHRTDPMHR